MLFFSKGDYGFISDGTFKIDNGEAGADLDFGGNVNITLDRNNSTFFLGTGDGQIRLNTGLLIGPGDVGPAGVLNTCWFIASISCSNKSTNLAPLIKGSFCPVPPSPGPINKPVFNRIKSQLKDAKSTKNFTE